MGISFPRKVDVHFSDRMSILALRAFRRVQIQKEKSLSAGVGMLRLRTAAVESARSTQQIKNPTSAKIGQKWGTRHVRCTRDPSLRLKGGCGRDDAFQDGKDAVLRQAQDFGARLGRRANASTSSERRTSLRAVRRFALHDKPNGSG